MKTTKLFIAAFIAGGIAAISTSCVPETPCPVDPSFNDSIWNNPYDSTNTGNTDSTYYGGDSGTPGELLDSVYYSGGGIDSTLWEGDSTLWGGDSTNFGG